MHIYIPFTVRFVGLTPSFSAHLTNSCTGEVPTFNEMFLKEILPSLHATYPPSLNVLHAQRQDETDACIWMVLKTFPLLLLVAAKFWGIMLEIDAVACKKSLLILNYLRE